MSGVRRLFLGLLPSLLLLGLCANAALPYAPPSQAQSHPVTEHPEHSVAGPELASVTVDGRVLFKVRGFTSFPAEQRAREIADRIVKVAADRSVDLESITVEDDGRIALVQAGDRPLVGVTDADAQMENVERQLLAEAYAKVVKETIRQWREERTTPSLIRQIAYLAGATLLLLGALYLLNRLLGRADAFLEQRFARSVKDIGIQRFRLLSARDIWRTVFGMLRILVWIAGLLMVYAYVHFALDLFPGSRALAANVNDVAMRPLRSAAMALAGTLPGLLFLLVLAVVTRYVLRVLRAFFEAVEHGNVHFANFHADWAQPTYRIVRLLVIVFALVVAYPYIPGSESQAFKGISLLLGVMFSLGSTSFIANVVAGYSMQYRRAFHVGDLVRIGEAFGTVTAVRMQVTHIRTPKNEEVVVPNSSILAANVTNYSTLAGEHGLILNTRVGIGYETPWRQVEAMLILAAQRTPGVRAEPPPFVLECELADFAVTYELNAYTDTADSMQAMYAALHRNILDVFNEYGVQVMTPAYERDTPEPKLVPRERWFEAPAQPPSGDTAPARPRP